MSCSTGASAIAAILLLVARQALGLEPPGVRWQISPGPDADGVPPAAQEAMAGPIGGSVANGASTLSAEGSASVDYGSAALHGASGYAPDGLIASGTWCSPSAGACSAVDAQWIDTIALRSPEAADGTTGSFAARLTADGALAAFLPEGWSSYLGTQVRASWSASVWIDGTVRDTLLVNCFGALGMPCAPSGVRTHYPAGGGFETTPVGVAFGEFPIGPYDFTWGQPFTIDVRLQTTTAVNRASNTTGSPAADAELTSASLSVSTLHDAGGGGGDPVAVAGATASAASGSAWLGVALPEPAAGAGAAAAALVLTALSVLRPLRRR